MPYRINFKKKVIVSVSEKNTNKKLELWAFIVIFAAFVLVAVSLVLNIIISAELNDSKDREKTLISELQLPENVKKETLYFLIKNRIVKIADIDRARLKLSNNFVRLLQINDLIKIENMKLIGNSAEISVTTEDYDLFDNLMKNPDEFGIIKDTISVGNTSYLGGVYSISCKFAFK